MMVLEPKEACMMRRSLQRVLTPEEHRLVRNWTLGVLIFYGAIALTALGVVSLHLHLADGANESAMTAVSTAATAKDQLGAATPPRSRLRAKPYQSAALAQRAATPRPRRQAERWARAVSCTTLRLAPWPAQKY
jgi:hypothetical protein